MGGMMNLPWIAHGRCTLYSKPEGGAAISKKMFINKEKWFNMKPELYAIAREQEEENILLRKMKEERAVLEHAIQKLDEKDLNPSEILDNVVGA